MPALPAHLLGSVFGRQEIPARATLRCPHSTSVFEFAHLGAASLRLGWLGWGKVPLSHVIVSWPSRAAWCGGRAFAALPGVGGSADVGAPSACRR